MTLLEQFKRLSAERFLAIYEASGEKGFGPLDGELAKLLKFRPQAMRKLPMEKRARLARNWIESKKNPELCYELFGTYLVRTRRELVTGFLDATGVPHQAGMIEDITAARPDPAKLREAVRALDARFEPEDVTLYLALCVEQWPDVPELAELLRERTAGAITS